MPRRRASKGNARTPQRNGGSRSKKGGQAKWDKREDIPLDEVDEFHEQRDRILLEGEAPARDSDAEDEEVFALKGLDQSSSDDGEEFIDGDEGDDDDEEEALKPKSKSSKVSKKSSKKPPPSDSQSSSASDSEEETWGNKKSAYYSSNAAQLDSDDEEAHEMEEQEARRLQAKLREPLREEDFGYADAMEKSLVVDDADDFWNPAKNTSSVTHSTDKASLIRHLQKTSPETLALAHEWDDIARAVVKAENKVKLKKSADASEQRSLGLVCLHHQTLLTYASVLAFYLYLRASPKYAARPELLRSHPILRRLLLLKQTLSNLEDLDMGLTDSEDEEEDELDDDDDSDNEALSKIDSWLSSRNQGLEIGELEELLAGVSSGGALSAKKKKADKPPKKKRKTEEDKKTKSSIVYDVEEPTLIKSSTSSSNRLSSTSADPYGEATTLHVADAADKGKRRKALGFHTSRIESASARRQGARALAGGDDDIPYPQRRKDADKKKRSNLGAGGDDLDDAEPEPRKRAREEEKSSSDDDSDNGYYSLVKRQKAEKKMQKKAEYDAKKEAEKITYDDDTPDGQRGISRAIMSNRGLTPHRSKSVRNPRVKKRLRFEKAKKKLSSQKAIYKGGIGDANRYGGETSGISKVVKSVRF